LRNERGWFAWSEALEKASQPILVLDRNLRIIAENTRARQLIGQNIGRHCAEALGRSLESARPGEDGELEIRSPGTKGNGRRFHVRQRLLNRRDGARWMITLEEVSSRKRAEPDELVLLSHELLSPLGTLKSYATVLQEMQGRISNEQERQYLLAIEHLCSRLARLVGNVIESWRLEKGGFDLVLRSVSLPSLVRSVALELQEEAPNHCIRVKVPRTMPRLSLDETKMRLLLVNLIGNALKYSPQGGTIEIVSEYVRSVDELPPAVRDQEDLASLLPLALVQVRDEGIGIPIQELEKIFDFFYRVDNGVPALGKGLGLSLCKAVVEAHGGRIWATSQPGKGSTFSLALPRNGVPAQERLAIA
jgi:signal transduction histidine kinase